jgi:hypothetical protein
MGNLQSITNSQDLGLHNVNIPSNRIDGNEFQVPTVVETLGNGRFLKTVKCMIEEGPIVVKVYIVHVPQDFEIIQREIEILEGIYVEKFLHLTNGYSLLSLIYLAIKNKIRVFNCTNVYPFQTFVKTQNAGYMLRQYYCNNLYDKFRFSFLFSFFLSINQ